MSALVPPQPGNRFRFRFVFVSCVRAGEAKLRGRVRGVPPHRWASGLQIILLLAGSFRVKVAALHVGFKRFGAFIEGSRCAFCAQACGF